MRVYLSGPMTGIKDYNFPEFNRLESCIKGVDNTIEVVNPAEISEKVCKNKASPSYYDYLKADIKELVDCDCVICLDGWSSSRGARIEVQLAEDLGIRIFFGIEVFYYWFDKLS